MKNNNKSNKLYQNGLFLSFSILCGFICSGCTQSFIDDLYVEPVAAFEIENKTYEVWETVEFINKGSGQKYVVYPGDSTHIYGKVGNTGYATASDGTFSYSYDEPGSYKAVWIASSINANNEIISDTLSAIIKVTSTDGGLGSLDIKRVYKMTEYGSGVYFTAHGEFISADTIMCPIIFDAWRTSTTVNSIKAKQLLSFELSSSLSTFWWENKDGTEVQLVSDQTSSKVVEFLRDGKLAVQHFIVQTASGLRNHYYVAAVIIPKMTQFEVAGVSGTIERNVSYYNRFTVTIPKSSLPTGTDLSAIKPSFEIMNNDANLVDESNVQVTVNGVKQTSGVSTINASAGSFEYQIDVRMLGQENAALSQTAYVEVNFE